MMTMLSELKSEGWYLSNDGLDLCSENINKPSVSSVIKKALDMDLREIGGNFLPEDLTKGKMDSISGPGVIQIQKVKNASAPKYEYGSGAPPILRLLLTDGNNYINCLQWGQWKSINMNTPPGTKIYLKAGKIPMQSNFLLLSEHQFTILGGCVAAMVEKWELCRKLASHIRTKESLDGVGPPPWIPFGQQIVGMKSSKPGSNFRSLESDGKEAKEDAVFKQQRQANIAEISRVKEIKAKSFGGRKEKPFAPKSEHINVSYVQSNDYLGNENDTRKVSESAQESPLKYKSYNNDRNRKSTRNDYAQGRQDNPRSYSSNNNNTFSSQSMSKDNKLENRSKLGDFLTQDIRQHSAFQAKSSESEPSLIGSSRQYKTSFNKDYRSSGDKRSQKGDSKSFVDMMDQVKIYGYDTRDDRNNFISGDSVFKPGMEVMAKYWEDNKYYRAIVHAVGKEGKTCVVHFLDYGNYEEVMINDVTEKTTSFKENNWNAGPVSFHPSPRSNSENSSAAYSQNYRDVTKPHQGSNRMYNRHDNSKTSRPEYRSAAKLYQPPNQRDHNL